MFSPIALEDTKLLAQRIFVDLIEPETFLTIMLLCIHLTYIILAEHLMRSLLVQEANCTPLQSVRGCLLVHLIKVIIF